MTELEEQRLKAEIEKLTAEAESFRRPSLLQRYVALAGIVGGLSGVAALMQVGIQASTLRYDILEKRYTAENEAADAAARANAETALYTKTAADLREAQNSLVAYRGAVAAQAVGAGPVPPAPQTAKAAARGIIQIFLRAGQTVGGDCGALLSRNGYAIGGVGEVSRGPVHDEVKYFWPQDGGEAADIAKLLSGCKLNVPQTPDTDNVVLITGDPGSASSPHRYFEVWVGTSR